MLRKGKAEDVASLLERAVRLAVEEKAESVYIELKQHYLLIRFRRASRMRMMWRGSRSEGLQLLAYLKAASGMNPLVYGVAQAGEFPFVCQRQIASLSSLCKPYLDAEKVVLSLLPLLRG